MKDNELVNRLVHNGYGYGLRWIVTDHRSCLSAFPRSHQAQNPEVPRDLEVPHPPPHEFPAAKATTSTTAKLFTRSNASVENAPAMVMVVTKLGNQPVATPTIQAAKLNYLQRNFTSFLPPQSHDDKITAETRKCFLRGTSSTIILRKDLRMGTSACCRR